MKPIRGTIAEYPRQERPQHARHYGATERSLASHNHQLAPFRAACPVCHPLVYGLAFARHREPNSGALTPPERRLP